MHKGNYENEPGFASNVFFLNVLLFLYISFISGFLYFFSEADG